MENLKKDLIDDARTHAMDKYDTRDIYPVGEKETFDECFTHDLDMLIFWYDVDIDIQGVCGRTTGITTRPLPN